MIAAVLLAVVVTVVRAPRGARPRRHAGGQATAAVYFDAVAAELRRGASLRHALALPVPGSRLARLALTGQPIDLVAAEVGAKFGPADEVAVAAVRLAGRSGAPAAMLFVRLAARARAAEQRVGERRAATAQARLSAAVVGLLPALVGVWIVLGGRSELLVRPGPVRRVILLGLGLQLLGAAVIVLLLRKHR